MTNFIISDYDLLYGVVLLLHMTMSSGLMYMSHYGADSMIIWPILKFPMGHDHRHECVDGAII